MQNGCGGFHVRPQLQLLTALMIAVTSMSMKAASRGYAEIGRAAGTTAVLPGRGSFQIEPSLGYT
jgi:hypothetical protein